jgi:hypothetical protein
LDKATHHITNGAGVLVSNQSTTPTEIIRSEKKFSTLTSGMA